MLTLRQIEVARAVMVTGTLAGAAKLLNVSAPGISRLMKYTEQALGLRLFDRRGGRLVPSAQARVVFEQINAVYAKVEDLRDVIQKVESGAEQDLRFACVPSISQTIVPRAVAGLRGRYPKLGLDINILKIEEAADYLLLGHGEMAILSSRLDHPALVCETLVTTSLLCALPDGHPLARRGKPVSVAELVEHPLIGIDPSDPHGAVLAAPLRESGLDYALSIRARFGTAACALVKAGLGVAVIDPFTVAHGAFPGVTLLPLAEPTRFDIWLVARADTSRSTFGKALTRLLRDEMQAALGVAERR